MPGTGGRLRFIEVKGRTADADSITVTKNEILTALNKPADFILALVVFPGSADQAAPDGGPPPRVYYLREPFQREPDFGVTSVNYKLDDLIARAGAPS